MDDVLIFAYGSNLCLARIRQRAPSASPMAVACLEGHRLCFHKAGRDGSGKADAFLTGDPADRVWGVVYRMSAKDKRALDRVEGVGTDYRCEQAEVVDRAGDRFRAAVYLARPDRIDPSLRPFDWYKSLALDGARSHDLPPDYLTAIEDVAAVHDRDEKRSRHELEPLGGRV